MYTDANDICVFIVGVRGFRWRLHGSDGGVLRRRNGVSATGPAHGQSATGPAPLCTGSALGCKDLGVEWIVLGVAALIVGISKTSFGGLGSLAVALFALAMPTKESTAAALILLITGDVVAVLRYRKAADWRLLRALLPAVIPGLLLGAWFLSLVDDLVLKRSIGWLLLAFVLIQLGWQLMASRRPAAEATSGVPHRALSIGAGVAAGFTTMAANAAGPVMALYLQLAKVEKLRFLGTGAWYFFIINLTKVPLSASLGLFTPTVLTTAAALIPVVVVGTFIGMLIIGRIPQRAFDIITLLASVVAAGALLVL